MRLPRASSTSTTRLLHPQPQTRRRPFSHTTPQRSGDAHGNHYDPPTGWLWGVPPGTKPEKEGWEGVWFWGFWGSLVIGAVGWAYKPDTSIQHWALEEARRRLEAEGILPDVDAGKGAGAK
ncbi:hypothetical protein M501DRAFT_975682 [Patellaria atrata CBS 101060]|uniref:NADH dehydrogenase [ubiquinone] 1 beta subcomplex subunit 11, mitochondrial n=1 Tax=Patellaria atrata CBS 101060 TaxID=1346257 RepID=A0A9P4VRG5_9PEZI|nr:hypothetical protein M501DRAFT_975682 [Patellaria atrata CBS 101060]